MKHLAIITICFAFAVPSTRNQSTSHLSTFSPGHSLSEILGTTSTDAETSLRFSKQCISRCSPRRHQICGRSKHDAITKPGASKSKTCWAKQPGQSELIGKTSGSPKNYIKSNYIMDIHYTISTCPRILSVNTKSRTWLQFRWWLCQSYAIFETFAASGLSKVSITGSSRHFKVYMYI